MSPHILALDVAGAPHRWITVRGAAHYYVACHRGSELIAGIFTAHRNTCARNRREYLSQVLLDFDLRPGALIVMHEPHTKRRFAHIA